MPSDVGGSYSTEYRAKWVYAEELLSYRFRNLQRARTETA